MPTPTTGLPITTTECPSGCWWQWDEAENKYILVYSLCEPGKVCIEPTTTTTTTIPPAPCGICTFLCFPNGVLQLFSQGCTGQCTCDVSSHQECDSTRLGGHLVVHCAHPDSDLTPVSYWMADCDKEEKSKDETVVTPCRETTTTTTTTTTTGLCDTGTFECRYTGFGFYAWLYTSVPGITLYAGNCNTPGDTQEFDLCAAAAINYGECIPPAYYPATWGVCGQIEWRGDGWTGYTFRTANDILDFWIGANAEFQRGCYECECTLDPFFGMLICGDSGIVNAKYHDEPSGIFFNFDDTYRIIGFDESYQACGTNCKETIRNRCYAIIQPYIDTYVTAPGDRVWASLYIFGKPLGGTAGFGNCDRKYPSPYCSYLWENCVEYDYDEFINPIRLNPTHPARPWYFIQIGGRGTGWAPIKYIEGAREYDTQRYVIETANGAWRGRDPWSGIDLAPAFEVVQKSGGSALEPNLSFGTYIASVYVPSLGQGTAHTHYSIADGNGGGFIDPIGSCYCLQLCREHQGTTVCEIIYDGCKPQQCLQDSNAPVIYEKTDECTGDKLYIYSLDCYTPAGTTPAPPTTAIPGTTTTTVLQLPECFNLRNNYLTTIATGSGYFNKYNFHWWNDFQPFIKYAVTTAAPDEGTCYCGYICSAVTKSTVQVWSGGTELWFSFEGEINKPYDITSDVAPEHCPSVDPVWCFADCSDLQPEATAKLYVWDLSTRHIDTGDTRALLPNPLPVTDGEYIYPVTQEFNTRELIRQVGQCLAEETPESSIISSQYQQTAYIYNWESAPTSSYTIGDIFEIPYGYCIWKVNNKVPDSDIPILYPGWDIATSAVYDTFTLVESKNCSSCVPPAPRRLGLTNIPSWLENEDIGGYIITSCPIPQDCATRRDEILRIPLGNGIYEEYLTQYQSCATGNFEDRRPSWISCGGTVYDVNRYATIDFTKSEPFYIGPNINILTYPVGIDEAFITNGIAGKYTIAPAPSVGYICGGSVSTTTTFLFGTTSTGLDYCIPL